MLKRFFLALLILVITFAAQRNVVKAWGELNGNIQNCDYVLQLDYGKKMCLNTDWEWEYAIFEWTAGSNWQITSSENVVTCPCGGVFGLSCNSCSDGWNLICGQNGLNGATTQGDGMVSLYWDKGESNNGSVASTLPGCYFTRERLAQSQYYNGCLGTCTDISLLNGKNTYVTAIDGTKYYYYQSVSSMWSGSDECRYFTLETGNCSSGRRCIGATYSSRDVCDRIGGKPSDSELPPITGNWGKIAHSGDMNDNMALGSGCIGDSPSQIFCLTDDPRLTTANGSTCHGQCVAPGTGRNQGGRTNTTSGIFQYGGKSYVMNTTSIRNLLGVKAEAKGRKADEVA